MISKVISRLDCINYTFTKRLFNKVTEAAEGSIKSLENMPEKRDIVKDKEIVSAGSASHPFKAVYGEEGFPQKVVSISESIEKKLSKYIQILPESSRMKKPLEFSIEDTPFQMMIDKSKNGITNVSIKQYEPVSEVLKSNNATILDMQFDKNGQMINGTLMIGDKTVSEAYRFTRTGKNIRRIDFEEMYRGNAYNKTSFKPVANHDAWAPIKDDLNRCGAEVEGLSTGSVAGDPLGYLFFELTGLKKVI